MILLCPETMLQICYRIFQKALAIGIQTVLKNMSEAQNVSEGIYNWKTDNVTDMSYMFFGANNILKSIG